MGGMNPLMTYMLTRGNDDRRDNGRIDSRFRDGRGRDHYDNGRFAPMRSEYDGGIDMNYNRTNMGYTEPVRMGGYDHDMDARRSWEIIENTGPHMEPRYDGDYNRDGMRRVMGFAGSSYVDHPRMDEMTHRSGEKMPGHASTKSMPVLTREMAEYWMENLQNEDGTKGPHWSLEDIKAIIKQRSLQVDPIRLWVAMNAEYSDSVMTNRKHGVDKQEFYLDTAIAKWLKDKDAVDDKEAAYFMHVVKH